MSSANYIQAFKSAITRVYDVDGNVVGAGFLVSDNHILTCTHIIASAFKIPQYVQEKSGGLLELDFPLIRPKQRLNAQVIFWNKSNSADLKNDIACLQLKEDCPLDVRPLSLIKAENHQEHSCIIFGFPQGHREGIWATGVLHDDLQDGLMKLQSIKILGYPIEAGFSGSPVWDESLGGVVGMIINQEEEQYKHKFLSVVSAKIITQVWDTPHTAIVQPINTRTKLTRVQDIKVKALEQRLSNLEEDYKAVYNQLNYSVDLPSKARLERQLYAVEEKIQKIEKELTFLTN